ncbi:hypothetical protein BGZ46_000065 [Entomortierella lignicola]|nr:hypothetical protein BGZ46_000065 [Entomortierella lignicola]
MDAGIIAAFKRRYRRLYWERTLIIDTERESLLPREQGVSATSDYDDIFKISQLEAMEFVKAFWKEITETTITNCFQHTRIFNTSFVQELSLDDEGASSEEDGGQDQLCTENNLVQEISAIDEDVSESYLNFPTPGTPQYRSPANLTTENAVDNELSILI